MDNRIRLCATLAVALGIVAGPANAVFTTLEVCDAPVELTLRQAGHRDLGWIVCGAGGELGDASAAFDTATEGYSDELLAAVRAEEGRASGARATRRGNALDVSVALDVDGKRRALAVDGLAIGAAARAVPAMPAVTLQAEAGKGSLIRVMIENEMPRTIAARIAEVTELRIDGIDRLGDATPMTLNFRLIPVRTVLQLVAGEGGVLLLQAHRDRYAFSTPAEAKAFNAAMEAAEEQRGGDDRDAQEAALARAVAVAPVPPEGPAVDITTELDELARLRGARKDYAGAEQLQRRRLELEVRIGGTRESAVAIAALDQVATLRDLQDDRAGAEKLFREVTTLGERVTSGDRQPVAHAWMALAAYATLDMNEREAERRYARATAIVRAIPVADIAALETSHVLTAHAFALQLLDRADEATPLLERVLAIMNVHYGEKSSMAGMAMEDLAENLVQRDELVRGAELYVDALMIRTTEGEASPRVESQAREVLELVAALGPYARRDPGAKAAAELRSSLAADPPSPELLSRMTVLLEKRAERQRGDPALAITCDGYAEVFVARVRAGRGGMPELLAHATDTARRDCLGSGR